jgi:hypothetical protein
MKNSTTRQQQAAIVDFVAVAKSNGIANIWAALPRNHRLVASNAVGQIRRVKDAIAEGWDELGNRIFLTADLRVLQD